MTFLTVPQTNAQRVSDKQRDELIGSVKIVRTETHFFDFIDGAFVESLFAQPDIWIATYDINGDIKRMYNEGRFHDGWIRSPVLSYDSEGKVIEEATSYGAKSKYVHSYDSDGKRFKTEYYEEGEMNNSWTYEYSRYDEAGNWIKRVATPSKPVKGMFFRTIEYRQITYY